MNRELKENVMVAESLPEQQEMLFSDLSAPGCYHWLDTYYVMLDALASGGQLDLTPDHSGHANHCTGKTLCNDYKALMTARIQALCSYRFMRLLAARHTNGFYIYSLEKLII